MRTSKTTVVFILALVITGAATARQLAMLVEVTPREVVKGGTLTEIVVRVAPEDRTALGKDVMLWVELTRTEARVLRKGWALKIDDPDEPLDVEIVIPDGPHVLRVDLKGAEGRSTGLWWGDVDVSSPASASASASESVPAQAAVGGAFMPRDPEATEPRVVNDPPTDSGPSVPVSDDGDSDQEQQSAAVAATEAEAVSEPAPEAVGGAFMPRDPDADGSRVVNDPPTADSAAMSADSDPALIAAPDDSEQRRDVASGSGPGASCDDPTFVSTDCGPPPTVVAIDNPGPPYGTLTVYVTRDNQPVTGLDVEDFEVRIGGNAVDIRNVEAPGEGVTILGVAVDLHRDSAADASWIGSAVGRLADRVFFAPGLVMPMYDGDSTHDWVRPDQVPAKIRPADEERSQWDSLSSFVVYTLSRVRNLKGRPFLMVITDGRGADTNTGWKEAHRHAAEAGVPILVAGLWHEDFGSGLRKDLRKLAAVSGGSVFYLQGPSQADQLVERFGSILDGSYSLGVFAEPDDGRVKVALVGTEGSVVSAGTARYGHWRPPSPQNRDFRGHFTYMADAAIFKDCVTGRTFPVAMQGDYLAAERAYLGARGEPGSAVLVTIEGRLESRPPMEGDGLIEMIVIDRFIAVHAGEDRE